MRTTRQIIIQGYNLSDFINLNSSFLRLTEMDFFYVNEVKQDLI